MLGFLGSLLAFLGKLVGLFKGRTPEERAARAEDRADQVAGELAAEKRRAATERAVRERLDEIARRNAAPRPAPRPGDDLFGVSTAPVPAPLRAAGDPDAAAGPAADGDRSGTRLFRPLLSDPGAAAGPGGRDPGAPDVGPRAQGGDPDRQLRRGGPALILAVGALAAGGGYVAHQDRQALVGQVVAEQARVSALEARIAALEWPRPTPAPVRKVAKAPRPASLLPPSVESAIRESAAHHQVDRYLLTAIVWHESRGIATATRYEARYGHLWDVSIGASFRLLTSEEARSSTPPADWPSTSSEWVGQRTSWGPCQLMGAVAREQGFRGPFGDLLEPSRNVDLCAFLLARLVRQTKTPTEAVAAFGAGLGGIEIGRATAEAVVRHAADLRRKEEHAS